MTLIADPINRRLTPAEAAEMLGVGVQTLAVWRCNRRYPLPFIRLTPRCIRYELRDVERFIESRRVGGDGAND